MIQQGCEDCGGIESRKTHEINRAIHAHQCDGMQIADESVVLNRLISHMASASVAANNPISPAIFRTGNLPIKIEYYRTKYNLGHKTRSGKFLRL